MNELKKIESRLKENVLNVFDLKNAIRSKKSYGGTSFMNIQKMINKYKKEKKWKKKIFLLIVCFTMLISCGKKADPEYKESKKIILKKLLT